MLACMRSLKLASLLLLLHAGSGRMLWRLSLRGGGFDVSEAMHGKQDIDYEYLMRQPASTANARTVLPPHSQKGAGSEFVFDEYKELKEAMMDNSSDTHSSFNSSDDTVHGFDIRREVRY